MYYDDVIEKFGPQTTAIPPLPRRPMHNKARAALQQFAFAFVATTSILATTLSTQTANAQNTTAVRELFDGSSLRGWNGDPNHWRVENGAIVGEIKPGTSLNKNTWLVCESETLADFDLQLQFKLTGLPAANSGIQFRCQVQNVDHVSGYQADLDMGATWLGRIYDEHGRALLVERGSRVTIDANGERLKESFAPANQYAVLFRENDWNEYRIVAVGHRVAVYINGTLFSELDDRQTGEHDLNGQLAFQLHSGPETRIEFRNVRLEHLSANDPRYAHLSAPLKLANAQSAKTESANSGFAPKQPDGKEFNAGFESGSLTGWTATGNAFRGQPLKQDGIAQRWRDQTSNKSGDYFIAGFEIAHDEGTGTLVSDPIVVSHPYLSFLLAGGEQPSTRVEVVELKDDNSPGNVIFTVSGKNREQMDRVAADLRSVIGKKISIRLIDENAGGWGHLNFDDLRFHDEPPVPVADPTAWRSLNNPVLNHLTPNIVRGVVTDLARTTLEQMHVPNGFSVDLIAAEPDLHQPMAITFDARGRLWVVEGYCYPQKRPEGEGNDRVLILEDADSDGHFESRKVFTEGLNLVSGLEVGHGGVWIGAAPQLLFIPDRNADDIPDGPAQVMLDGFGYADTHETLNSFLWGPDGWLYGNQGVFNTSAIGPPDSPAEQRKTLSAGVWRFHPVRKEFEVFAHGGSNQWGLDYDDQGQIFMTHCRSFWGKGSTTHVIQGGHFWNQVNSGYAPFVSAEAPSNMPWMKNYLLASARYDHGAGGAGKPGTDEVYGGHSHVGTMIYLGDNWPAEYRNHLLTHNLHGHQINHQINRREGGGYNTVHAGQDLLFCADRQYIGVDLLYGPDGAVYMNDWYDPRHCHNPDVEQWDRGNGRIYRMKYDATWQATPVDYTAVPDSILVTAQLHPNDWHVRASRLVLAERAQSRAIDADAVALLQNLATTHADPTRRLRAIWSLHAINQLSTSLAESLLNDSDEYVRAWTIQLSSEHITAQEQSDKQRETLLQKFVSLAESEPSMLVTRYLASAIQRLPNAIAWDIADRIAMRREIAEDRELPGLLWFGIAQRMPGNEPRAFELAEKTPVSSLRDFIQWYAAKTTNTGRNAVLAKLESSDATESLRLLTLLELALKGMRGIEQPNAWKAVSAIYYDSPDPAFRRPAESIGASFSDPALYSRMRERLMDASQTIAAKRHAVNVLSSDLSAENLPVFLASLETPELVTPVIPLLKRFNDLSIPRLLLSRLKSLNNNDTASAIEVLCSRVESANMLLDAIANNEYPKSMLTAFYARQMAALDNAELNQRLEKEWGKLGQTSGELLEQIQSLATSYKAAPLWAYSGENGASHFKKLCAQCHIANEQNEAIAPKLAGSGAKGIDYLVENVINPNAVIGRDYQARIISTAEGQVITGVVEKETESSITVRTLTSSETIAKDDILNMKVSTNSFMPEGLLNTLNDREKIELFKYLMGM